MALRKCSWLVTVNLFPTLLTWVLYGWSAYVFLGVLCIPPLLPSHQQQQQQLLAPNTSASDTAPARSYLWRFYVYSSVYIVLWLAGMISFLRCAATDTHAGYLPTPEEGIGGTTPVVCPKCQAWKPERCHHCSVCKRCTLKMDHHCPWVGACIGLHNYKYFLLFLFYTTVLSLLVFCTTVPEAVRLLFDSHGKGVSTANDIQILILCFVAILFGGTVGLLLMSHIRLTAMNLTTLEQQRLSEAGAPLFSKSFYDLGSWRKNFDEVLGHNVLGWFLPIKTHTVDGYGFHDTGLHTLTATSATPLVSSAASSIDLGGSAREQASPLLV